MRAAAAAKRLIRYIRMTGKVHEVSMDEIKAKQNPAFDMCVKDYEQYPAMVCFCITDGRGDIFDYDFEKMTRDNKLERTYFSYHGMQEKHKGLQIDQSKCIGCGACKKKCSFLAVQEEAGKYRIDSRCCDECGDCYLACPVVSSQVKCTIFRQKVYHQIHPVFCAFRHKVYQCYVLPVMDWWCSSR